MPHASSKLSLLVALASVSFAAFSLAGCTVSTDESSANSEATGGFVATGGVSSGGTASGGAAATGGAALTGGAAATGGAATGGALGTGGDVIFKPATSRVVGYAPTWEDMNPASFDFDTLTHVCVAFANPPKDNAFGPIDFTDGRGQAVSNLVAAAHAKGVYVLASIAGWNDRENVGKRIAPDKVDAYVAELVGLVNKYALDGIDVDIEGEFVNGNYAPFVQKLRAALPAPKLVTAAVANWNGDSFASDALAAFDFINVMSYDHGSWWEAPGAHSSLHDSISDINYWATARGVPSDRIVLGVPFYGYCWGASCPGINSAKFVSMKYATIVASYPAAKTSDWLTGDGYTISLNSPPTIKTKAELAKTYGGVMIWELGQDAGGADSLFKVIRDAQ